MAGVILIRSHIYVPGIYSGLLCSKAIRCHSEESSRRQADKTHSLAHALPKTLLSERGKTVARSDGRAWCPAQIATRVSTTTKTSTPHVMVYIQVFHGSSTRSAGNTRTPRAGVHITREGHTAKGIQTLVTCYLTPTRPTPSKTDSGEHAVHLNVKTLSRPTPVFPPPQAIYTAHYCRHARRQSSKPPRPTRRI